MASATLVRVNRERFHSSLLILQAVALATLVRSIAFDRWITVIASTLLFVGAPEALQGAMTIVISRG